MENHGEEEAVERTTDGEDGDGDQHTNGVSGFMVVKTERTGAAFCLLALEIGSGIADWGGSVLDFLGDLLHETLPELFFLFTTLADLGNGGVDPFGETAEERHQVGD